LYFQKSILLRDLKFCRFENNFAETLKIMNNVAKNFDILAIWAFYIIILIAQQNYF